MSRLDLGDDIGLKVRDQSGGVRIAPVGAVGQMLKQPLQKKQITDGKRLHRCCAEACGKPRLQMRRTFRAARFRNTDSSRRQMGGWPCRSQSRFASHKGRLAGILATRLIEPASANLTIADRSRVAVLSKLVKSTAQKGSRRWQAQVVYATGDARSDGRWMRPRNPTLSDYSSSSSSSPSANPLLSTQRR